MNRFQEYPKHRYHREQPGVVVTDPDHEKEIAPDERGWVNTPAAFEEGYVAPPPLPPYENPRQTFSEKVLVLEDQLNQSQNMILRKMSELDALRAEKEELVEQLSMADDQISLLKAKVAELNGTEVEVEPEGEDEEPSGEPTARKRGRPRKS